ncbi:MAG TPA: phosphopantetheine-binding protein [Actinophytocola sp.]|uniref:phosphopantetheine-binding protein n=1 Tax=Actinophytocola sp. TaxID=1872138 RepID=UPI002DB6675E|nr:phosphopantetheine-binding protein [Actinophytocola sp.]HEU5473426.1 phosphopantetheine-binding protein [Actinophytocola sp.]
MPEITELPELTAELARLWMEVLGVDSVDEQDDFFDLGGHSLSALRLSTLIRYELELPVMLPQVVANPRYADLREVVAQAARDRLAEPVTEA